MKALITSGGKGTRLRPITHTSNKHLIPIANKPMIHYAIEAVVEAGIREIGVLYNPDTGAEIREALASGDRWGVKLTYILQERPEGRAHVVKVSRDFLGDEPFVFYLGDNVVVGGIRRFIDDFHKAKSNCHL
ncbi:MAG: NTP transferase domain-containing protein, partial [Nitrospirae bacterium]|nr:NTP transferase domain-containing protein [Nitrospirota bacterium]